MENINIEAIIASKSSNIQTKLSAGYKLGGNETLTLTEAKVAIKEIVEAVINKCAEEAEAIEGYNTGLAGSAASVDKESILKVKEMINY